MSTIQFIYFDIGGVLIDWSRIFETAASKFNLQARNIGEIFDENVEDITKGLLSPKQFWEKCIHKYSLKNASDYDFLDSWVSDYRPIQEMHELVMKIKDRYRIGLLSNIYKGMLPLLLKKGAIPNIQYEQIIFSCDVGMMKPNPDIYALAQQKAQTDTNNILLVDDRKENVVSAKKAHWNTFLFDNKKYKQSVKELEEYLG